MSTPSTPRVEGFEEGVEDFLASFQWVYFTHYFPSPQAHGVLLRLLTLSGLDSYSWKHYTMHLVALVQLQHPVVKLLTLEDEPEDQVQIQEAVQTIWDYATDEEALVQEPPISPTYLSEFGYTQKAYLTDLHLVYGKAPDGRYRARWPEVMNSPWPSFQQQSFAHKAVSIMGTTAGAIAYIVKKGMVDDEQNGEDNQDQSV